MACECQYPGGDQQEGMSLAPWVISDASAMERQMEIIY